MRPQPGRRIPPRRAKRLHFHCARGVRVRPATRVFARLLGPCFKTGRRAGAAAHARPRKVRPGARPAGGAPRGLNPRADFSVPSLSSKFFFNFPSRYLFAICLVPVFSLRRGLPPTLGCILKQPDSRDMQSLGTGDRQGPDTCSGSRLYQRDSGRPGARRSASLTPQCTAPARAGASALGSSRFTRRY